MPDLDRLNAELTTGIDLMRQVAEHLHRMGTAALESGIVIEGKLYRVSAKLSPEGAPRNWTPYTSKT